MLKNFLSVVSMIALLPAGAISYHPGNGPTSIENAADDNYSGFVLGEEDGSLFIAGGFTLLNPLWGIGSGHSTFSDPGRTDPFDSMEAGVGNNMLTSNRHDVTQTFVFPEYEGVMGSDDLVLYYFSQPLLGYEYAQLYHSEVQVGDVVDFATYDPAASGNATPTFTPWRQEGSAVVESIGFNGLFPNLWFTRFEEPGDSNYLPNGAGLNPGASGSGAFINGQLAGIWTLGFGTGYNSSDGFLPVLDYIPWIEETMALHPYDPTLPVPEPGSLTLLGMGIAGFVAQNLRRAKKQ